MFEYSVVIPAYNEAGCIAGAIKSVLAQSLPPKELIVVDDGSSDNTGEIAESFAEVRLIRCDSVNGSAGRARNTGLAACTSGWIAFLDADDRWHIDKIHRQANIAATTDAGLVYCGALLREHPGEKPQNLPVKKFTSHRSLQKELITHNCIVGSSSSVLINVEAIRSIGGFDATLARAEDWDMWLRLSQVTRFAAVRDVLVILNKRKGALGDNPQGMFESELAVIKRSSAIFQSFRTAGLLRRRAEAGCYQRRAVAYFMKGRYAQSRRDFQKAAVLWPLRLKTLVPLVKLWTYYRLAKRKHDKLRQSAASRRGSAARRQWE